MNPYIYDLNTYTKATTAVTSLNDGNAIDIFPLSGYEDSESPFLLYWWMPGILTKEGYFIRSDFVRYHIMDTDADRGFKIQEALIERLNKGDNIQGLIASTEYRTLSIFLLRSGTGAFNAGLGSPREREGFYEFQLNFQIEYVPLV